MNALSSDAAAAFARPWLRAWTGNRPEELAGYYAHDIFYSDPAVPDGLTGKEELLEYLRPLLRANPDWVWSFERSIPLENGFLNFWSLTWPVGRGTVTGRGVCTVQIRDGLIYRNEVFFDTHPFRPCRPW